MSTGEPKKHQGAVAKFVKNRHEKDCMKVTAFIAVINHLIDSNDGDSKEWSVDVVKGPIDDSCTVRLKREINSGQDEYDNNTYHSVPWLMFE